VPVVAIFQSPSLTQDQYEQVVGRLTDGQKKHMEAPGDWPVDGLVAHVAGQGANGFRVVDVRESEEAFGRFGGTIVPILEDLGIDLQPEVYSDARVRHRLIWANPPIAQRGKRRSKRQAPVHLRSAAASSLSSGVFTSAATCLGLTTLLDHDRSKAVRCAGGRTLTLIVRTPARR
jgi:hypothetical protein